MEKRYELYIILDAEISAEKHAKEVKKIEDYLSDAFKATRIVVDDQGSKKLAYPIKKTQVGRYVLIHFSVSYDDAHLIAGFEKKLNVNDAILRYILVDITEHELKKSKESINSKTEYSTHLELNKGKPTRKRDIVKHLGIKSIDYKDTEFLKQFISPYHKVFHRKRVGNSAKTQRMISQAIKRARHMALIPFTPKHEIK